MVTEIINEDIDPKNWNITEWFEFGFSHFAVWGFIEKWDEKIHPNKITLINGMKKVRNKMQYGEIINPVSRW